MKNFISRRLTVLSVALLALLPLLFLWRVALLNHALISLDMLMSYEPWRSELPGAIAVPLWNELVADTVRNYYPVALYIAETWQQGQIPTFYPYAGNSFPLLGTGFFQALYPINVLLWLVIPVHIAFGWSAILHLFFGSLFTFLFLKELGAGNFGRLISAISFTYCGSIVIWLGVPSVVDSMVWLPLMFWGFEAALRRRDWRWVIVGTIGGALQILGGHIQLALYGFTALSLYGFCRAGLAWSKDRQWRSIVPALAYTLIIIGLSCGLAAYQLLPTFELLPTIIRSDIEFEVYTPPQNLLRTIVPDILGVHMDGEVMGGFRQEAYLYFGLLPLFFLVASLFSPHRRITRSLFGIGLLFLLVIYNVPPFFQLFYYTYPTFKSVGFLRMMYVITFLWAAAAGLGADWLLKARPPQMLHKLTVGGIIIGIIALIYVLLLSFAAKYQVRHFWNLPKLSDIQPNLVYHLTTLFFFLTLLTLIVTLFWQWGSKGLKQPIFVGVALSLLVFDLFLTHIDRVPALPESMLYPVTPSLQALQQHITHETELFRISGAGRVLWPGTAGALQTPSVSAYTSFPLKRYDQYADATGLRADSNFRVVTYHPQSNKLLDALNVKYLYATRSELADHGWVSLLDDIGNPQIVSEQAGAGQVEFWNIKNWTQPVLQAPAPTAISFLGLLPDISTLETAIAVHPDDWHKDGVQFEIYTGTPDQPLGELVFSQVLTPRDTPDHQGWVSVALTLTGNPPQPTLVSFVTQPVTASPILAGWADPIIQVGDTFELLYYGPNNVYLNKNYLPRAWVVHQVKEVPFEDAGAVIAELTSPEFNPAVRAVIEGKLPTSLGQANPQDAVTVANHNAGEVVLRANLNEPGFVILSDIYYPGWDVYVDGIKEQLYPTNLVMRGVFVEGGSHTIRFVYQPFSFRTGVLISIGTLVIVLVMLIADSAHRHQKRSNSGKKFKRN